MESKDLKCTDSGDPITGRLLPDFFVSNNQMVSYKIDGKSHVIRLTNLTVVHYSGHLV